MNLPQPLNKLNQNLLVFLIIKFLQHKRWMLLKILLTNINLITKKKNV